MATDISIAPSTPVEPNIVNVTSAADLPATLAADTTYIVNGHVTTSQAVTASDNSAIIGRGDRHSDILEYTGVGTFLTITDVNFALRNLQLRGTGVGSTLLSGSNYTTGVSANSWGRTKVLTVFSCEIRNAQNIGSIRGFELVDFNNTLIWYVEGSVGLQFAYCRHLEMSSCEVFNWFDEATGTTYSTAKMIEFLPDSVDGIGFAVVNINGCIVHPEQAQDGLSIDATSSTIFGTIAANTFINVGLTTGTLFDVDYDIQNAYIIQSNQGVQNGNALGTMDLSNNTVLLDNSVTNPIVFNEANTVGGGGFTSPVTFPLATRVATSVPNCFFRYDSEVPGNFYVALNATVERSGDGFIEIRIRQNGTAITTTVGKTEIRQGRAELISFSLLGIATIGDVFDIEIECQDTGGSLDNVDVLVRDLTWNGYQF